MRSEHKDIQSEIKQTYSKKYDVFTEVTNGRINLPNEELHAYQPDVIIKKKGTNDIIYIIEVENDPMRKVLVGAAILADYSIKILKNSSKPNLIFVVYTEEGIKQIQNFTEKLKIAKIYCNNLKYILIYSIEEFRKVQL